MKISDRLKQKIANVPERFAIVYAGSFVTGFNGDDIVEVIKKFNSCFNACIDLVWDKVDNEIYISQENDDPDVRGRFNLHYINSKGDVVYNEDEATAPLVVVEPSKIYKDSNNGYIDRNGNFYECGPEEHNWLAKELIITGTFKVEDNEKKLDYVIQKDWDVYFENKGFIKISDSRITHFLSYSKMRNMLTFAQKETLRKYIEITGRKEYEFQYFKMSKDNILSRIDSTDL